jgi:hypothetical protein
MYVSDNDDNKDDEIWCGKTPEKELTQYNLSNMWQAII